MNKAELLDAAKEAVTQAREQDYGTAQSNFDTIAELWTTYLRASGAVPFGLRITAVDVASLMVLVKLSRITTSPGKEDHWVDIAGYAACGAEVTHSDSSGS